jgi:hypothetical protein
MVFEQPEMLQKPASKQPMSSYPLLRPRKQRTIIEKKRSKDRMISAVSYKFRHAMLLLVTADWIAQVQRLR